MVTYFFKKFFRAAFFCTEIVCFDKAGATVREAKADTANAEKGQRLQKTMLFESADERVKGGSPSGLAANALPLGVQILFLALFFQFRRELVRAA